MSNHEPREQRDDLIYPQSVWGCDHLKEAEAGAGTGDLCRRHGISSSTFYKWKEKFGGMEVSDAKKLRALDVENNQLKKVLAEAMLDNPILKDVNSEKW